MRLADAPARRSTRSGVAQTMMPTQAWIAHDHTALFALFSLHGNHGGSQFTAAACGEEHMDAAHARSRCRLCEVGEVVTWQLAALAILVHSVGHPMCPILPRPLTSLTLGGRTSPCTGHRRSSGPQSSQRRYSRRGGQIGDPLGASDACLACSAAARDAVTAGLSAFLHAAASFSRALCCKRPCAPQQEKLPQGPELPERRRDDVPAGNPKEKPGTDTGEKTREAPPAKPKE
jgi:hypothetical protein